MNEEKNSKAKEKSFLAIVKSHLKDECNGCKKLHKNDEFELLTVPEEVLSLLAEFTDIALSKMIDGLSPLQDIQHHIDFLL